MKTFLAMAFFFSHSLAMASSQKLSPISSQGVYGSDRRLDYYELPKILKSVADASMAIVPRDMLKYRSQAYEVDLESAKNDLNLCPGERFREQQALAECSATFIGKDLAVTAGHCITKAECRSSAFIFNYKMLAANTQFKEFTSEDVYFCSEIVARQNDDQVDFAVVRLDRMVSKHQAAPLAKQTVKPGARVYAMGYPSGLPFKFASPANVQADFKNYFVSRLDTFEGSSGSGVFSEDSHELVGILVRGGKDYDYDKKNQCYRVHNCQGSADSNSNSHAEISNQGCEGEEVTKIDLIRDLISD